MSKPSPDRNFEPPSRKSLIVSIGIAMLVSALILVTVILPAEYSIDPTGLGNVLGLTALSEDRATTLQVVEDVNTETVNTVVTETEPMLESEEEIIPGEYRKLPTPPGTTLSHGTIYRTEILEISLGFDEELEYKATLAQDEPLLYSWETDKGMVYYDFHGEPTESDELVFMSYEEGEKNTANGYLLAPFTGNHGWYFLNISDYPITVKLTVSGYFTWLGKIGEEQE